MPHPEQLQPPQEGFAFSERERLFYRVSTKRFQALLNDPQTTIHSVELSTNVYGEYLFVTASRPTAHGHDIISFFGLGFHEYRERWLTEEWFWYDSATYTRILTQTIPKAQFKQMLDQRRSEITPYLSQATQSEQGRLFDVLADVFDEDGTYSAIQDMEIWADVE